jgi:hypothetical protein
MLKYIGFGGQYRSGKDAASDHLYARLSGKWKRASLGHAVKKIFAEHFNVSMEFIEEWKVKEEVPPGFNCPLRDGLIKIGDGWRDTKADIWIRKLFDNNKDNLIISDVRYINEAEHVRNNNGIMNLVWRPGYENKKPSRSEQELMQFVKRLQKEPSGRIDHEKYPDVPFDFWLVNDGNYRDWLEKVDNIVLPYALKRLS